jgi:putative tryptophan/tyrosine transport system substrate-binding protein
MRRREFILTLGAGAAWPLVARAQQTTVPVIGFLHVGSATALSHLVVAFRQGLKQTGYVVGYNVAIEFRWAEGHYDWLPALATELVQQRVAMLITGGGEAPARAAESATKSIPIVFNVGNDPAKSGLVANLSRPGGNATGVNIFTAELAAKRLGLLSELIGGKASVALLINPNFPPSAANVRDVHAAAHEINRNTSVVSATTAEEIDAAFATMDREKAGAVIVDADPFFYGRRDQIVALASRYRIPAVYEQREFAIAGGLMSYGTNIQHSYQQMGIYAGQILKGIHPSDLPVMQLSNFELVINMKAAKVLGLSVPPGILAIADEVIE